MRPNRDHAWSRHPFIDPKKMAARKRAGPGRRPSGRRCRPTHRWRYCRDRAPRRAGLEEGVEVLFKAFEGKPFSHQGKYYTIPPEVTYRGYTLKEITLVPALERLRARVRVHGEMRHQRQPGSAGSPPDIDTHVDQLS